MTVHKYNRSNQYSEYRNKMVSFVVHYIQKVWSKSIVLSKIFITIHSISLFTSIQIMHYAYMCLYMCLYMYIYIFGSLILFHLGRLTSEVFDIPWHHQMLIYQTQAVYIAQSYNPYQSQWHEYRSYLVHDCKIRHCD